MQVLVIKVGVGRLRGSGCVIGRDDLLNRGLYFGQISYLSICICIVGLRVALKYTHEAKRWTC
jgi:hypothetical protein